MDNEETVRPELKGAPSIGIIFLEYVDEINQKYFNNGTKQAVHSFAMAVGIQLGKRMPREEYGKNQPGSQFSAMDGIRGIIEIFRINGDLDNDMTPVLVASEYINGGLKWLKEIGFETGSDESFDKFRSAFPHLMNKNVKLIKNDSGSQQISSEVPPSNSDDKFQDNSVHRWPPSQKNKKTATWVEGYEGILAGSERPGKGTKGKKPVDKLKIDEWIKKTKEQGIKSIICLLSEKEINVCYGCLKDDGGLIGYYEENGFDVAHIPAEDYMSPPLNKSQIKQVSTAFENLNKPVLVHCSAAVDRTKIAINEGIIPHLK